MASLVRLANASFKGFKTPLNLEIGSRESWVVLGPKKQLLLEILAGKHTPQPATAISYPSLGRNFWPSQVIEHVVFGETGNNAPYLSARYEAFRDEFDYTVRDLLQQRSRDPRKLQEILQLLKLDELQNRWFASLSNGQTRRAQLALALMRDPKFLIIDEPFLGLDPQNRKSVDSILQSLPIPKILGARSQEAVPSWATHIAVAEESGVKTGRVNEVSYVQPTLNVQKKRDPAVLENEPVIELRGVTVSYWGQKPVLENLHLTVRRGERLHIKGPNGSGKSTLIALITADHPKSWNEKVVLFGEPRQVGKQSYFSINQDIGHTSPEIHSIFPRHLTLKQAISTAFAEAFVPPRKLDAGQESRLAELAAELKIESDVAFGQASLAQQKLALFARALAADPKILILDEAFSTLNPVEIERAFDLLDQYTGTALVIGHVDTEVPLCDSVVDLSP